MSTYKSGEKKRKVGEGKKSDLFYDEEGDIVIISSDNIAFKLPAFRLSLRRKHGLELASRKDLADLTRGVFRGMIQIGTKSDNDVIALCDLEIENSEVLTDLFNIIIKNQCFLDQSIHNYKGIIGFMQKYDFERDLEVILQSLQLAVGGQQSVLAFVAASHLGDMKLCGRLIAGEGTDVWDVCWEDMVGFGKLLAGYDIFDPRSWEIDTLEELRPAVSWALLRASTKRDATNMDVEDKSWDKNKAMSVEFLRLMKLEEVGHGVIVRPKSRARMREGE